MVNRVEKKIIYYCFVEIILYIFALSIGDVCKLAIISIIQLIIEVLIIKQKKERWFCLPNVFIILSYIIHMGNLIVVCICRYDNNYVISLPKDDLCKSILFFMLCHFFFTLGVIFIGKYVIKIHVKDFYSISYDVLNFIGWLCLIVGIFPRVYIDFNQIILQVNGDYRTSLDNLNKYGIIGILGLFFYSGVAILIYTSEKNVIRARILIISTTIWEIITMLSGSRIYPISFIIVMFYLYCLRIEKPKFKTIILLFIFSILISILMTIISEVRRNNSFSFLDIQYIVSNGVINDNPICSFLAEIGGTMKSVVFCVQNFPSYRSFVLGKSYMESIVSLIPFIGEKIVNNKDLIYIYAFRINPYLGGSWIGEVYYNFSWFGCLVCTIVGHWVNSIDLILSDNSEKNNILKLFCLVFLFYIIRYIRDYFYCFTQPIQMCMVLLFIGFLIRSIKRQ